MLLVENIGELLTMPGHGADPLGIVHDAAVLVVGTDVVFAGPRSELRADSVPSPVERVDAGGRLVTPGLIDPHTHLVFAGSRAGEFDLRAQGKSYLEIQQAGGGIMSTVRATRAERNLYTGAEERLGRLLAHGVTVVEAKTGYDLTIEGEAGLLEVLDQLRDRSLLDISPTLLAHVPPPDMDRTEFVRRFCEELSPHMRAQAVDVYCDAGAFTLAETEQILRAARAAGKLLRVHAEQFTYTGAAELAADLGAASVEHLEQIGPHAPEKLAAAGTVCNLLPGAALTLKLPWPDARRLIAAGCQVALGTDCNPGSSLTESLPLMMSLACMQMGMSCAEAWLGVTRHAARALRRERVCGHLQPGARGDLVIWDEGDYRELLQHFGAQLARTVAIRGQLARRDHATLPST